MIEGISGVIGRISEINARIDEIKSLNKNQDIKSVKPEIKEAGDKMPGGQKPFSEVLKQVLAENGKLPGIDSLSDSEELSGNEVNRINRLIGSKKENLELLNLLYQGISKNGNTDINTSINEASQAFGVDKSLIKAVIQQESEYHTGATSEKGAMGLMQIMPDTAELMGVKDPYNANENIAGGTKYLKILLNKYNNNLNLALAAYNAGPAAVDKYGDVPPFEETQDYVKKVLKYYNEFKSFE